MSVWMALALAIILVGGLAILSRLRLLEIAVCFWVAFAAGIAVLAASGHEMTARWHLGPVTGWEFWRVLVFSPEILVFLFFMITDPKTIPAGRRGRRAYAVGIGAARRAPDRAADDRVRDEGRRARRARARLRGPARRRDPRRACRIGAPCGSGRSPPASVSLALAGAAAFAGLVVLAGIPPDRRGRRERPGPRSRRAAARSPSCPSEGVSTEIDRGDCAQDRKRSRRDLRVEAEALAGRDRQRATEAAARSTARCCSGSRSTPVAPRSVVPDYHVERAQLTLEPSDGQAARSSSRRLPARESSSRTRARRRRSRAAATRRRSSRRSSSSSRTAAT